MKLFTITCSLFLASAALPGATITNFSFETPALSAGGYQYLPGGSGWTFTQQSGIISNGSGFSFANAPDGTQAAFLQSISGVGSSISQTVTGVLAGDVLSFYIAQRPGFGANTIDVFYDGTLLGTVTPSSTTWTLQSLLIPTGLAANGILLFQTATPSTADVNTGLDAITLAPVPEPGTLGLMGIALACVALINRRAH